MNTPIRTRTAVAAIALLLPMGLGACGDDNESADEPTTTASSATSGTAAESGTPAVMRAWARTAAAGGNGAIYMAIAGSGESDALVGASVPADLASRVELHETTADTGGESSGGMSGDGGHMGGTSTTAVGGEAPASTAMGDHMPSTTSMGGGGMMKMRQVEKIPVPADGTVELKPGGYHVMLFDLKKALAVGDTVEVTLTFEKAGQMTLTAEVREL